MLNGPKDMIRKARTLRRKVSVPEVRLRVRLRLRACGLKFRRQHRAGAHVLDFYCHEARLAIAIDGIDDWPVRDTGRLTWLSAPGVAPLRLSAADVMRDVDGMIETIVHACRARGPLHDAAHGPPPRSGEEM